jgi:hypothetical protein
MKWYKGIRMFKKICLLLVFLFLGLFLVIKAPFLKAQENGLTKVKSEAIPLEQSAFYVPCEDPDDPSCVPFPENTAHPDPANKDHETLLSNIGFPPNTEVYIVGCINTDNGPFCTTGSQSLDRELNNIPGGDTLNNHPTYQFKAATNPAKSDAEGNLEVIVRSYTPQVTGHFYNAYVVNEQNLNPTSIGIGPSVTPEESLHLETFIQETPTPVPIKIKPRKVRRRVVDQDPKGRMFDIKSLEPIPGVEVTLLDSFKKLFSYKQMVNPQIVLANGEFSFWVPNGIYYLQFAKLPETHIWPVEMDNVHSNYTKAYYCDPDVKNSENMPVPLYYDQFSIVEFNKLVHCDVPLDPGTNAPIRSSVKTVSYGLMKDTLDGSYTFTGIVTHPFTKVQLVGQESQKVVQEIDADKHGSWKATIAASAYPLNEQGLPDKVLLKYIKVDLTAQKTYEAVGGVSFDPLLSYVEGYAYDRTGNIIANAKVGVKQKNNDNVVYLTTANAQGFFQIGSQYLPSFPYDLVFSDPEANKHETVTSSNFLTSNKDYLASKQLNLVAKDERAVPLTTVGVSSFKTLKNSSAAGQQATQDTNENQEENKIEEKSQTSAIFGLLIIVLITAVSGLLIFKLKKKPEIPPPFSL